jgi:ribosomal-protein-alanine N-acetyltransferase
VVDGEVLGLGVLQVGRDTRHRQGDISYAVHPRVWRRGVGTAIGSALLRIGFADRGLHRIAATCDPRNAGSAGILRRLGMTYEGRLRHTMMVRDGWRDSETFGILECEWRATAEPAP